VSLQPGRGALLQRADYSHTSACSSFEIADPRPLEAQASIRVDSSRELLLHCGRLYDLGRTAPITNTFDEASNPCHPRALRTRAKTRQRRSWSHLSRRGHPALRPAWQRRGADRAGLPAKPLDRGMPSTGTEGDKPTRQRGVAASRRGMAHASAVNRGKPQEALGRQLNFKLRHHRPDSRAGFRGSCRGRGLRSSAHSA
jgi:hypothetical protein